MSGYRPLTREQRADHVEALFTLARLVVARARERAMRRTFVVLSLAND